MASVIRLWGLIVCICFILNASNSPALEIEYQYKGQEYRFQGEKIKEGEYIFNKGQSKHITLATLDWPPYVAHDICGQGWVQQVVVGIFLNQGYTVHSHFFPWKRAVMMVGDPDVLRYTVFNNLSLRETRIYMNKLETVFPVIEEKSLYLAFSTMKKEHQKNLNNFNITLDEFIKAVELDRLRKKYTKLSHLGEACE